MNILYIFYGHMGDVIAYTPVIRCIKKTFPDSHLTCAVSSSRLDIPSLKYNKCIDKLIPLSPYMNRPVDPLIIKTLAQRKYEYIYNFSSYPPSGLGMEICENLEYEHMFVGQPHLIKDTKYKDIPNRANTPSPATDCWTYIGKGVPECPYLPEHKQFVENLIKKCNPEGKPIVLFNISRTHFMPFHMRMWDRLATELSDDYCCLVTGLVRDNMLVVPDNHRWIGLLDYLGPDLLNMQSTVLGFHNLCALIDSVDIMVNTICGVIAIANCYKTPTIIISEVDVSIEHLRESVIRNTTGIRIFCNKENKEELVTTALIRECVDDLLNERVILKDIDL